MKEKSNTLLIVILVVVLVIVLVVFALVALNSLGAKPPTSQPPAQPTAQTQASTPTPIASQEAEIVPTQKPLETFVDPIPNEVPPRDKNKIVVSSIEFGPDATISEVILLLPDNLENTQAFLNGDQVDLMTAREPDLIASFQVPTDQPIRDVSIKFMSGQEIAATCNIKAGETIELSGDCIW